MITLIVLTYNEEVHIQRCLRSVKDIASKIIVVDSFSNDKTCDLAEAEGATVVKRNFINQAEQLQWAIDNCKIDTDWVLRLDADEYCTPEVVEEIKNKLPELSKNSEITGVNFKLRVYFLNKWIKHGGYYPMILLRMWKNGKGHVPLKQMDERMVLLSGKAVKFENDLVDENLKGLTFWIDKHNKYSVREVGERMAVNPQNMKANKKIFMKIPLFLRSFMYFFYRFFLRLGFLDGKPGLIWHFLQGFWYQFLIDAKIYEINLQQKLNSNANKK